MIWFDLRPEIRAQARVYNYAGPPRRRWRLAYRQERLRSRMMARLLFQGTIGTYFGTRYLRSSQIAS